MFDFADYLAAQLLLKPTDFQVAVLDGGLTNVTVRASFTAPISFSKSLPFSSVVLKYAPPYIAADPTQAMSVHRQVIEANALCYLAETPEIQDLFARFPNLKIPHLIHHDSAANPNAFQIFDRDTAPYPTTARELGATLGAFISDFWKITAHPTPDTAALFARTNEQDDPVHFLSSTALKVMSLHGVPDAEILSKRVRTTMQTKDKTEPCLGMVDFWPGSILICPDSTCGLVDWEYFGLSTPGAEIGMLVAHLHLIISQNERNPQICGAVRTFIAGFLESYGASAPLASTDFNQQALVAYGREMVNALEFFATELEESGRKHVLDVGVRSLRSAGVELDVKLDDVGGILWDEMLR
ncbi:kinase-like domain-containing protein [Mycena albidolilacea]|uniref:Kinase-like domain-containing protein n=1 Tax=Mycena albidolilacea TaxID=1033008 RepID=A0AAD7A3U2_9AGAR|nr:kinase-like domain-containing protein [Mycena albidolilacea]